MSAPFVYDLAFDDCGEKFSVRVSVLVFENNIAVRLDCDRTITDEIREYITRLIGDAIGHEGIEITYSAVLKSAAEFRAILGGGLG